MFGLFSRVGGCFVGRAVGFAGNGDAGFFGEKGRAGFWGLYGFPPPGWGAVNRLGVISFSIYGFGLLYFFSNPLPVWLVLTAFNG